MRFQKSAMAQPGESFALTLQGAFRCGLLSTASHPAATFIFAL
jgi:hypothetical protein